MVTFPDPLPDDGLRATWDQAWLQLAATPPAGLREALELAWQQPQRHYHDRVHLGECLALWQRWQALCEWPGEVAVALWFHDSVYDPQAGDNEARSAAWAVRSAVQAGLPAAVAQRIEALILATRHEAPAGGVDAQVLVDIDLAILGAPAPRFARYDADVRREYVWVPEPLYRRRRAEVLRSFAQRRPLYRTAAAAELLEAQARANLAAALSGLQA